MKVVRNTKTLYEFDITPGRPVYKTDNSASITSGSFHRVGYYMELQSAAFGNQWVYTEFDAFSGDPKKLGIPLADGNTIQQVVSNLDIQSSDGTSETSLANGHIEFSAYNYAPGTNNYDANDDLEVWKGPVGEFGYGCMQVHSGTNVLWAFNCHNNATQDVGIGNNSGNEHKDWTFMFNAETYTKKTIKIYVISNKVIFDEPEQLIEMRGVAHGDSLIWNSHSSEWGQTQIQFEASGAINKPNFIIALTGQSNSQGYGANYDSNEPDDQPHERIFGFNPTTQQWETADLNTESLGATWHKALGAQSLAFHMARRLVEAYPDIRPGIINLGVGGQPISRWAKFGESEPHYALNVQRAANVGVLQGDIYDLHVAMISQALGGLDDRHKNVNAICWHQGESDGWDTNKDYYKACIERVIAQYRETQWCSKTTPFIVGETTGGETGTDQGWEARNVELRELNVDADPYTKCIDSADLTMSHDQYNNGDRIHFSTHAQRKMGTRYFRALREMYV